MKQTTITITWSEPDQQLAALRRLIADLTGDPSATLTGSDDASSYTAATADVDGDQLGNLTQASINAEELEVARALLEMCRDALTEFPTATRIRLDDSDQGNWACLGDVTDDTGASLLDEDYWEDGDDYASHLYSNRNYMWEEYLVDGTSLDRRNPCSGTIVIAKVIADLAG